METPHTQPTAADERMVSVIIPTFNEAETLEPTIAALRGARAPFEIIVVDALSADATAQLAAAAGARLVTAPRRQRAAQMNLGAQHARGSALLFLHADTKLAPGALERIVQSLERRDVAGGAFARRYDSGSVFLRITCWLANLRNHLLGWHLGDQAMFARKSVFFQLGGFREVDQFEDLDFSRRLKAFSRIVTLTPPVISSARRFAQGAARRTLRDIFLTIRYLVRGLPETAPDAVAHRPILT